MQIVVLSFGFRHGLIEADYVFDLRFLPNPFWVPELQPVPGTEPQSADYVLQQQTTKEFLALLQPFLTFVCAAWAANGRKEILRIALGCTGGYHRSVALAEHLAHWLSSLGYEVSCQHRDLEKNHFQLQETVS